MAAVPLLPCPVRLGTVKHQGPQAKLHRFAMEKNLHKMEKLLKKGVEVDCINHLGQTPLFCASLLGLTNVVDLLLQYGANPNHRCLDWSTPVHAAAFSCKPWLLSSLLDAGGDLRLHDWQGRTPWDWVKAGAQEQAPKMQRFLRCCKTHMSSLMESCRLQEQESSSPTSSKSLLHSPSLLNRLRPLGPNRHVNKKSLGSSIMQCYGFGKLCTVHPSRLLASMPLIADRELRQADDEPMQSYTCGSHITMTNYSWKGCRVTVKELHPQSLLSSERQEGCLDLLITEQEYCSQLFHPHLLQLLAISMTADLTSTRLVYERVYIGSLYNVLHHRREEFPLLQAEAMLSMVLQVCEALFYLHAHGLVLRGLSSHCVQMVTPSTAKITGLGFIVSSNAVGLASCPLHGLPEELYNWAAPEVIQQKPCSVKTDIYSLCALIQELYTDAVPWGAVDPQSIKQNIAAGHYLTASPSIPQPYYNLVSCGLQPRAQDRTNSLQDLRICLQRDIQELILNRRSQGLCMENMKDTTSMSSTEYLQNKKEELIEVIEEDRKSLVSASLLDHEVEEQLQKLDEILESGSESTSECELHSMHSEVSLHEILSMHSHYQEDQDSRPRSRTAEYIGELVLNLKASKVLLQQAEDSLSNVERVLAQQGMGEVDKAVENVDWHRKDCECLPQAVGPPPRYQLLPRHVHPSASAIEEKLLSGGSILSVISTKELLLWQEEFPPRGEVEFQGATSPSSTDEDPTYYTLGQEESILSQYHLQGTERSGSPDVTVRRQQQTGSDQTDGTSSGADKCQENTSVHGEIDTNPKSKWTGEVSKVVARSTRSFLWTGAVSDSSQCEHREDMTNTASRMPLCSNKTKKEKEPQMGSSSFYSLKEEWQRANKDLKQEYLFKNLTGHHSGTEDDNLEESDEEEEIGEVSEFNNGIQTLLVTQTSRKDAIQPQEEISSQSDDFHSPVEPSSLFYTPNLPQQTVVVNSHSQTSSSDDHPDVTQEVCQPAGGSVELVTEVKLLGDTGSTAAHPLNAKDNSSGDYRFPAEDPAEIQPDASESPCDPFNLTIHMPDQDKLEETNNISCSPIQPEQNRQASPVICSVPCNSTPRSPEAVPTPKPRLHSPGQPLPSLQNQLDMSLCNSISCHPHNTDVFASKSSEKAESSLSSVVECDLQFAGDVSLGESASPSGLEECSTASTVTSAPTQSNNTLQPGDDDAGKQIMVEGGLIGEYKTAQTAYDSVPAHLVNSSSRSSELPPPEAVTDVEDEEQWRGCLNELQNKGEFRDEDKMLNTDPVAWDDSKYVDRLGEIEVSAASGNKLATSHQEIVQPIANSTLDEALQALLDERAAGMCDDTQSGS